MTTAPTPALPTAATGRRPSFATRVFIAAGVLLAVAWSFMAVVLHANWREALDAETRQNTNLASALEEQTLRVLAAIDQATLRVAQSVSEAPGAMPDLSRFANETGLVPDILVQLSLVGPDGRFAGSNLDPDGSKSQHVDLSTREHIRVHLAPATTPAAGAIRDGLFIGRPVLGKVSGKWTIQLTRRIADARGQTLGVVVASLDPGYFETVFRRVSLGSSGGVSLIGADLAIRARVLDGKSVGMGGALSAGSTLATRLGEEQGHYIAASGIDGVERVIAFRRVARYPLYVTVATGTDEALADWRSMRDSMLLLNGVLTAVVLAAALAFAAGVRRLERSNDALRASEARALAASQAKTEFLAAMSHELRTPLTSIRGFAELMERRLDQPVFRQQATMIRKAAERLHDLLTEILDMTGAETGALQVNVAAEDLASLLHASADFFAPVAAEKGLVLDVQLAPGLPQRVLCDRLRVKQILHKLLSNAVKFTESGTVVLSADVAGDRLRVHVTDTGPGVDPAMHDRVFEVFRQGDARVSYEHGGTGLGLSLSRALADLMGGTLSLRSAPGLGACFTLELPLQRVEAPDVALAA